MFRRESDQGTLRQVPETPNQLPDEDKELPKLPRTYGEDDVVVDRSDFEVSEVPQEPAEQIEPSGILQEVDNQLPRESDEIGFVIGIGEHPLVVIPKKVAQWIILTLKTILIVLAIYYVILPLLLAITLSKDALDLILRKYLGRVIPFRYTAGLAQVHRDIQKWLPGRFFPFVNYKYPFSFLNYTAQLFTIIWAHVKAPFIFIRNRIIKLY